MGLSKDFVYFYKILIFLLAFALVAYATIAFGEYLGKFRNLFLATGRWEWVLYITVFLLALGWLLKYLLRLQFRVEAGIKNKPKRKR